MQGLPPHTPHPGYLSVRLLHCRGYGPASRSGGQPVCVAALAGLMYLGGWGAQQKGQEAEGKAISQEVLGKAKAGVVVVV